MTELVRTNQLIRERQQAMRAAAEARKTLAVRLREHSADIGTMLPVTGALLAEAAEAVDWYEATIAQMRRNAVEEQREARRDARDAFDEGRASAKGDYYPGGF